jgi:hypothetical protein
VVSRWFSAAQASHLPFADWDEGVCHRIITATIERDNNVSNTLPLETEAAKNVEFRSLLAIQ